MCITLRLSSFMFWEIFKAVRDHWYFCQISVSVLCVLCERVSAIHVSCLVI